MVSIGKSFHYFHSAHKSGKFMGAEGEIIQYEKKFGTNKQYVIKKQYTRDLITDVDCRKTRTEEVILAHIKKHNASLMPKEARSFKRKNIEEVTMIDGVKYRIIKRA